MRPRKSNAPVGGGGGQRWAEGGNPQVRPHDSRRLAAPQPPFVYRWRKPGRGQNGWPVVAKLTFFAGSSEPVLAIVWRGQRGTTVAISEPRPVLLDAQSRGAQWSYLRDDNPMLMWRIAIEDFLRGRLRPDGEHYVLRSDMQPVPWREWEYAKRVLYLEPVGLAPEDREPAPRQLSLFGVAR
jgi:hypothetical protein